MAAVVLPGNAPDAQEALELVAQCEQHTRLQVFAANADAFYGDGHTRRFFHFGVVRRSYPIGTSAGQWSIASPAGAMRSAAGTLEGVWKIRLSYVSCL